MGLKERLLGAAKKSASFAGKSAYSAFNRADELGGEVRDYVLEHTDSESFKRLSERLARVRGQEQALFDERVKKAQAEFIAEATAAEPPPTAAALASRKQGLGDETIPAQVYGRTSCPWTGRAMTALNNLRVDYDFIDLDDPDHMVLQAKLVGETGQNTVPYVYLRGTFIGGFNHLSEVIRAGQFEYMTMANEAKAKANPMSRKSSIAPRATRDEVAPGELSDPVQSAS